MILSTSQIAELIDKPFSEDFIKQARKYADHLSLHITGNGLDKYFEQIKSYENDDQLKLRQKYARSNKNLFSELLRPLDKVFTARGGAKYYNLSDNSEMEFKNLLSDVRSGMSIEKWSQNVWLKKKITDPNGLIMMEISKDGDFCYPTYKSIFSIYDYKFSGSKVEYIIFEPETIKTEGGEEIRYRVIDDAFDYIVVKTKASTTVNLQAKSGIEINKEETLPNYFGKVPARMISDEEDEITGNKLSFIDSVIHLADEILIDNSIKIIFKYAHGFPGYWEIQRVCPVCNGLGKHNGEEKCHACGGDGIRKGRDISDKIIVTMDEAGKAGAIPPAGYVSTDTETWRMMNEESDFMERILNKSMWGTLALMSDKQYQKATPVISDLQPVYDRLNTVSTEAESMEKFLTDLMGDFYFRGNYKGSTIIYGKRFQIESPDQIWKKFTEGKIGHIPEFMLKNILLEWIQASYANDPYEMAKQIKILKADPYPVYDADELKTLGFSLKDIYFKIYFTQWVNMINQDQLLFLPIDKLITDRDGFINKNIEKYASLQIDLQSTGNGIRQ
jgi:hypothetical protein